MWDEVREHPQAAFHPGMGLPYVQLLIHTPSSLQLLTDGPDNIDYDDIKLLIKEHTTPGKGKATSVPGQGNEAEHEFESLLFSLFSEQHSRITLFVKSKTGEIGLRLGKYPDQFS
jgi:hypothetical protein